MHTTTLHTYIQKTTAAVVKQYNEHVEPVNQSSLSICQKHQGINYASFIKALCTRSSSRVATQVFNEFPVPHCLHNCLDNYRYFASMQCPSLCPFVKTCHYICQKHHGVNYALFIKALNARLVLLHCLLTNGLLYY